MPRRRLVKLTSSQRYSVQLLVLPLVRLSLPMARSGLPKATMRSPPPPPRSPSDDARHLISVSKSLPKTTPDNLSGSRPRKTMLRRTTKVMMSRARPRKTRVEMKARSLCIFGPQPSVAAGSPNSEYPDWRNMALWD